MHDAGLARMEESGVKWGKMAAKLFPGTSPPSFLTQRPPCGDREPQPCPCDTNKWLASPQWLQVRFLPGQKQKPKGTTGLTQKEVARTGLKGSATLVLREAFAGAEWSRLFIPQSASSLN